MIMIYEGIHIPAAIRSIIGILLADINGKKIQNRHLWLKSTCVNLCIISNKEMFLRV